MELTDHYDYIRHCAAYSKDQGPQLEERDFTLVYPLCQPPVRREIEVEHRWANKRKQTVTDHPMLSLPIVLPVPPLALPNGSLVSAVANRSTSGPGGVYRRSTGVVPPDLVLLAIYGYGLASLTHGGTGPEFLWFHLAELGSRQSALTTRSKIINLPQLPMFFKDVEEQHRLIAEKHPPHPDFVGWGIRIEVHAWDEYLYVELRLANPRA
jgi:hypothetical protein